MTDVKELMRENAATRTQSLSETVLWSRQRQTCATILSSNACEVIITMLVTASFILMVVEADFAGDVPTWLGVVNAVLLVVYTLEVAARVYVYRTRFFGNFYYVIDLAVVMLDLLVHFLALLVGNVIPSIVALRIFRMLRLARGFNVIVRCPQLSLMLRGLVTALYASLYGVALLLVVLTVWSVAAVEFLHPVNQRVSLTGVYSDCERCPNAFSNVRNSMLTFIQQIIAGDSWGLVSIPIIEDSPETAVFFTLVFVSTNFAIMNVILSVIVDSALKASQENVQETVKHKMNEFNKAARQLKTLCKSLDNDGSGDLTEEEILEGYDTNADFRDLLSAMDIRPSDLKVVFSILDSDEDGTVKFDEFISEVSKMRSTDSHTMLVFIKHFVTEIRKDVRAQLTAAKADIISQMEHEPKHKHERGASAEGRPKIEERPQESTCCSPGPQAELSDLCEELSNLQEVISKDLLCSIEEASSQKLRSSHGPAANAGQAAKATPSPAVSDGSSKPSEPSQWKTSLMAEAAAQDLPASAWSTQSCCRVKREHRRDRPVDDAVDSIRAEKLPAQPERSHQLCQGHARKPDSGAVGPPGTEIGFSGSRS